MLCHAHEKALSTDKDQSSLLIKIDSCIKSVLVVDKILAILFFFVRLIRLSFFFAAVASANWKPDVKGSAFQSLMLPQ